MLKHSTFHLEKHKLEKSAIESSHPYNLGGIGVTGNVAANTIAKEADLVIGIGTRFTDFTTASKQLFQNEEVEF